MAYYYFLCADTFIKMLIRLMVEEERSRGSSTS